MTSLFFVPEGHYKTTIQDVSVCRIGDNYWLKIALEAEGFNPIYFYRPISSAMEWNYIRAQNPIITVSVKRKQTNHEDGNVYQSVEIRNIQNQTTPSEKVT